MFCPNCGTANDDKGVKCQKCGFALRGDAVPRFKGTMMMMNAPPGAKEALKQAQQARPSSNPPAAVPPGPAAGSAAEGTGLSSATPLRGSFGRPRSQLKATMMGVAPPVLQPTRLPEPPRTVELEEAGPRGSQPPPPLKDSDGDAVAAGSPPSETGSRGPGEQAPESPAGVAAAVAKTEAVAVFDSPTANPAPATSEDPSLPSHAESEGGPDAGAVVPGLSDDDDAPLVDKPYTALQVLLFFATCGLYGVFRAIKRMISG